MALSRVPVLSSLSFELPRLFGGSSYLHRSRSTGESDPNRLRSEQGSKHGLSRVVGFGCLLEVTAKCQYSEESEFLKGPSASRMRTMDFRID